jgi:drug/metabolite transporter (DMT)-like permease
MTTADPDGAEHVRSPAPASASRYRGVMWILVAEALFSCMRISTRVGAGRLFWGEVAAARFIVGALVVAAVAVRRGATLRIRHPRGTWMRSIFGTVSALGTFYALGSSRIAVGDAAAFGATAPIFVAVLSGPLLGERVTRSVWAGVALGFAGVLVLLRPGFGAPVPIAAVAIGGAFAFSIAIIWLRRIGPRESSEAVALHMSLVAGAAMVACTLPAFRMPRGGEWLALAGAGLAGGLAQVAMTRAYALETAARVSAMSYLGVAFTYVLERALLGTAPVLAQVAGAATICAAGVLVSGVFARGPAPVSAGEA